MALGHIRILQTIMYILPAVAKRTIQEFEETGNRGVIAHDRPQDRANLCASDVVTTGVKDTLMAIHPPTTECEYS